LWRTAAPDIDKSAAGRQAIEAMYRRILERWPIPREEEVIPTRILCDLSSQPTRIIRHGKYGVELGGSLDASFSND
jgi:hypothetical protein